MEQSRLTVRYDRESPSRIGDGCEMYYKAILIKWPERQDHDTH